LVADLFTGTGSTAVATVEVGGGRRFTGCESDLRLVKAARSRVAQAVKERSKAVPAAKAVSGR
jgi:DNA modification methylase